MSWQQVDWLGSAHSWGQQNVPTYLNWIELGPRTGQPRSFDLSTLPCRPGEHYLVKHKTDWYECLKCHRTGEHVRDEPCTYKDHVAVSGSDCQCKSNHPKAIEDCKSEETLLEALLEEELALSQLLEEAVSLDLAMVRQNDDENLQRAIALPLEKQPAKRKLEEVQRKQEESGKEDQTLQEKVENTKDGLKEETKETEPQEPDADDDLEKALAMSTETLPPKRTLERQWLPVLRCFLPRKTGTICSA